MSVSEFAIVRDSLRTLAQSTSRFMSEPTPQSLRPSGPALPTEPPATDLSALPPALPPPVLPSTEPPQSPPVSRRIPRSLLVALIALGVLQLIVAFVASGYDPRGDNSAYRIGSVVGRTVFWPLLVLGLFSFSRRFREPRNRAVILLIVWGLLTLGQLTTLGRQMQIQSARLSGPQAAFEVHDRAVSSLQSDAEISVPRESPSVALVDVARYDFSPGSHERLIKEIGQAREKTYHEVTAAYAAACVLRPDDAVLALERVRFAASFAWADEFVIESAEDDYETARAYLLTKFPEAPVTVLYELETTYGDEFETKAARYSRLIASWTKPERAQFLLRRAERSLNIDPTKSRRYAEESFANDPTPEAGILLAQGFHRENMSAAAIDVLRHPAFNAATPWLKRQKMDLLFALGDADAAITLFEELRALPELPLEWDFELTSKLAEGGRVDLAREWLSGLTVNYWNRASVARQRFDLELAFGSRDQAVAAYRDLRASGFSTDPLARLRLKLLLKYPGASWHWMEIGSVMVFGLTVLLMAVLPLAVLIPVHYWSLLRQRRGQLYAWGVSPWGLRATWSVTGLYLVSALVAAWLFYSEQLQDWMIGHDEHSMSAVPGGEILKGEVLTWGVISAALLILFARDRAWRLCGPGVWSWQKALGIGLLGALFLRMGAGFYVTVFQIPLESLAQVTPMTTQLQVALLENLGAFGLIAVTGFFVPVFEEILFRGLLLGALARHLPFWSANLVQAVLFAAVHEDFRLAPFFMGIALVAGVLTRRARGLLPAIVLHATNNVITCVAIIVMHASAS